MIEIYTRPFHVLCNCYFPLMGFAEDMLGVERNCRFCDAAEFSTALTEYTDYTILLRRELDAPPCDASLELLSQLEKDQIKYHRPSRIGEIIFNYWD